MKKERIGYFDVLRIIAICAVVMIHTSAEFVVSYQNKTLEFILGNIFDSISRLGVPLFLMISGALMLDENRNFNCKKKVIHLLILLLIWSFFYAFIYSVLLPILRKESVNVLRFFNSLIRGHYHLWYMWAIIGLYLLTPIFRSFVKLCNKNIVLYFIILSLIFQFTVPFLQLILSEVNFLGLSDKLLTTYTYIFDNLNFDFLGGLTAYYLTGWYIQNTSFGKKASVTIYALGLLGIVCIILFTQLFPTQYSRLYSDEGIFVYFYSVAVFLLVKSFYKPMDKNSKLLTLLSKLSFGVYLIHILVLSIVSKILFKSVFYMPLVWFITVILCFLITYVISKIPIIKKFIKT